MPTDRSYLFTSESVSTVHIECAATARVASKTTARMGGRHA